MSSKIELQGQSLRMNNFLDRFYEVFERHSTFTHKRFNWLLRFFLSALLTMQQKI